MKNQNIKAFLCIMLTGYIKRMVSGGHHFNGYLLQTV